MEVCSAWADCGVECPGAAPDAQPCSVPALRLIPCSTAPARAQPRTRVGWSFSVPHHLIHTIPSPRQPCSLLLRALLSIWQHLQLLPPLLAGQLCHPMCHYPASLFLLTLCLQQGHSLCCLCLAAARKMLLQGLPLAPCLWGRGEYEKGKGSGRGRGKGNRKGEKQGEEQEGGRERQKGEAGKGKRGGPSLQEGAEGSICSTSLLIVAPRGPKSAGVKGRDEPRSHSLFLASELWQQDVGVTLWVQPAL